jgi:transcriptional repressor NrdR
LTPAPARICPSAVAGNASAANVALPRTSGIEESPIRVIKKDGTRVPFDREKIRFGVEKACYKRPVSPEQIDSLVGNVEATIYEDGEREVSSRRIGELVFNALRELDKVAFVRFASVYREFQDVNDFVEELQPILDGRRRDSLH